DRRAFLPSLALHPNLPVTICRRLQANCTTFDLWNMRNRNLARLSVLGERLAKPLLFRNGYSSRRAAMWMFDCISVPARIENIAWACSRRLYCIHLSIIAQ